MAYDTQLPCPLHARPYMSHRLQVGAILPQAGIPWQLGLPVSFSFCLPLSAAHMPPTCPPASQGGCLAHLLHTPHPPTLPGMAAPAAHTAAFTTARRPPLPATTTPAPPPPAAHTCHCTAQHTTMRHTAHTTHLPLHCALGLPGISRTACWDVPVLERRKELKRNVLPVAATAGGSGQHYIA